MHAHILRYFRGQRCAVAEDSAIIAALSTADSKFLEEQAGRLAAHMAPSGQDGLDKNLLKVACLQLGRQRGIDSPLDLLRTERGGFSDKRLEQAARNATRMAQIVATYRQLAPTGLDADRPAPDPADAVSVLAYLEGIMDGVARPDLPPIYAGIGPADAAALARDAVSLLRDHDLPGVRAVAEDVLLHLACLTDGALAGVHADLAACGVVYPGVLYRGAGPDARDLLLRGIEVNPNHILQCLAWIGDEDVQRQFKAWVADPPGWTENLFWLSGYTLCAGWELGSELRQRMLYLDRGRRLVGATSGEASASLKTFTPREDVCPWCRDRLVTILALDLSDPGFAFLGLPGGRIDIPTCVRCSAYGTVLADVDFQGKSNWSAGNRKPDYLDTEAEWERFPPNRLVPGEWMQTVCEGELLSGGSRLGGLPFWDQDPEYPLCPGCERHMPFLAQLDMADIEEIGEGNYYVFLCRDCGIAATGYQQT